MSKRFLRLGVNIDHVATVRNARGGDHPDPIRAAQKAIVAGADGITAHLREDRRHIRDRDVTRLRNTINKPLNLEMAATDEMIGIALDVKPNAVCIVPEKREEQTTEGGLDAGANISFFSEFVERLSKADIRVSLFIEPCSKQLDAARDIGAAVVELHTGRYCDSSGVSRCEELGRIQRAATYADNIGLECHAGHGLTFETVGPIASIETVAELNIGHFLMGEAMITGLDCAVRKMRTLMDEARSRKDAT
ncbi:MAG: pyridoxine 5'-phosphate synthase [Pseudomonadota bacterium]|nr:pyridoxine 5'-phosphate synthase [Pseudomonadota bacterium]